MNLLGRPFVRTGMRALLALAVGLACALAVGQGRKVLLVPLEIPNVPKMAEMEPEEVRLALHGATVRAMGESFAGKGHRWASPESVAKALSTTTFDPGDPKDRELDALLALGHSLGCDVVIVVVVERLEQKNRGSRDILSNAGKPASESKAKIRVWAADAAEGLMRSLGKDVLEGVAQGAFIGTTDRTEMGGSPEDKTVFIRLENKKRADGYGRAIADAAKKALGPWLGGAGPEQGAEERPRRGRRR